jgi:hypothetical protein
LIQWLYLSFCFNATYEKLQDPLTKSTNQNPFQLPNSARFLPQLDNILRAFEDELNEIHLVNKCVNNVIARLECSTSILNKKERSTLGPPAHPASTTVEYAVPPSLCVDTNFVHAYTLLPLPPLHLQDGEDNNTPIGCPPNFSFTFHKPTTPE